jgi:hypothetical protein
MARRLSKQTRQGQNLHVAFVPRFAVAGALPSARFQAAINVFSPGISLYCPGIHQFYIKTSNLDLLFSDLRRGAIPPFASEPAGEHSCASAPA